MLSRSTVPSTANLDAKTAIVSRSMSLYNMALLGVQIWNLASWGRQTKPCRRTTQYL